MQTEIPYLSSRVPGRVSYKCVRRRPLTSLFITVPSGLRTCPPPRPGSSPSPGRLGSFLPPAFAYVLPSTPLLLADAQRVQDSPHRSQSSSWEPPRSPMLGLILSFLSSPDQEPESHDGPSDGLSLPNFCRLGWFLIVITESS